LLPELARLFALRLTFTPAIFWRLADGKTVDTVWMPEGDGKGPLDDLYFEGQWAVP